MGFFLKSGYVAVVEMERNLDGVVVAGGAFVGGGTGDELGGYQHIGGTFEPVEPFVGLVQFAVLGFDILDVVHLHLGDLAAQGLSLIHIFARLRGAKIPTQ